MEYSRLDDLIKGCWCMVGAKKELGGMPVVEGL